MADLVRSPSREKKDLASRYELRQKIHEAEYAQVKKPIDTRNKEPIQPAYRFEVNIEPNSFTPEKSVVSTKRGSLDMPLIIG